jgi:hypothetical protein
MPDDDGRQTSIKISRKQQDTNNVLYFLDVAHVTWVANGEYDHIT